METAAVFFDIGATLVSGSSYRKGAKECLTALRDAGFRLGIISNTGDQSRTQLLAHLPSVFSFDEFDSELVVLSSEQAFEKPQFAIFQFAVLNADAAPFRRLFVGEDSEEVIAAQIAGMHSFRITTSADFDLLPDLIQRYLAL